MVSGFLVGCGCVGLLKFKGPERTHRTQRPGVRVPHPQKLILGASSDKDVWGRPHLLCTERLRRRRRGPGPPAQLPHQTTMHAGRLKRGPLHTCRRKMSTCEHATCGRSAGTVRRLILGAPWGIFDKAMTKFGLGLVVLPVRVAPVD